MGAMQGEVNQWLLGLEAQVAEGGWGQDHALWLGTLTDMGTYSTGDAAPWGVSFCSVLEIGEEDYSGTDDLLQLAHGLRQNPDMRSRLLEPMGSANIFAAAFSSEMWAIPPQDATEWAGRFSEHPNRQELRGISAIDHVGNRYAIMRRRSDDNPRVAIGAVGSVFKALQQILAALRTH